MKEKYLVLTGNEYGINILDNLDLDFVDFESAENKFEYFVEEYGFAAMYKVEDTKLTLIKDHYEI